MGTVSLCNPRVKSTSKQCCESCIFKFFTVCPLPGIVKICGKSFFFAAFFIDCTPLRIIGIFRLIVCCIHVIYTTCQTCIHDCQILIWKCDVHYQIRFIAVDQLDQLVYVICVHLSCSKNCFCLSFQFFHECITFFLCAACNTHFCEYLVNLATFLNCYTGYSAAADYKYSAHNFSPFMITGCFFNSLIL